MNMDAYEKIDEIIAWLENYKATTNCKGVVLGLSGGKDSTVVAMLAKKVWHDDVVAVLMPNKIQPDINDSLAIANCLNILYMTVPIGNSFDAIVDSINNATLFSRDTVEGYVEVSEKSKTNIAPRLRMTTLYGIAQSLGYQVIGTGNASEAFIGWTTKWGDSACDFNPIRNLTCSEVVEIGKILAKEFNLPETYIVKAPGDGLTGKCDEDNFGFTYAALDTYIKDRDMDGYQFTIDNVAMEAMHVGSEHKRRLPYNTEDDF